MRFPFRPHFFLMALILPVVLPLSSCTSTDDEEVTRKPVPPTTESSQLPWNKPQAGQGGGPFSAMPNTPRR
jgi:hypothetical protein